MPITAQSRDPPNPWWQPESLAVERSEVIVSAFGIRAIPCRFSPHVQELVIDTTNSVQSQHTVRLSVQFLILIAEFRKVLLEYRVKLIPPSRDVLKISADDYAMKRGSQLNSRHSCCLCFFPKESFTAWVSLMQSDAASVAHTRLIGVLRAQDQPYERRL